MQAAQISVVDEHICIDLSAHFAEKLFFRITFVDGIKLDTMLFAEFNGFVQLVTMTVGPQNQTMPFLLQGMKGIKSKDLCGSDFRKIIFNNGPIKINGYLFWKADEWQR